MTPTLTPLAAPQGGAQAPWGGPAGLATAMNHLANLNVLVLGLGESGLAMARWCARFGATVTVWDSREQPPQAAALRAEVPAARLRSGVLAADALAGVQMLLKSPGLAPGDERIAPLLALARATGIAVGGELDLFIRALADLRAERGYAPKLLAITGTNGKTTTTAMCALLVARCGLRVAMAGNIGPTLLDTLASALDADAQMPLDADLAGPALPEVWVLELSSFQLDGATHGTTGFAPDAATVLNISQDHLDWHGSMDAYVAAKAHIFGEHTLRVINRDDPRVALMLPALVMAKGGRGKPALALGPKVCRFGLDAPQRPGDFGLVVEAGMAWLVRAREVDETLKRLKPGQQGDADEIHLQRLMPADALRVRGRHNAANALAALALATAIGCPLNLLLHGLREYHGEPHRVEFVATVGGVPAYDDSKGTNVGASLAALLGLGTEQAPGKLLVILGGDGKGQDFTPLASAVAQHARAVALIGRDAAAIDAALAGHAGAAAVPRQHHDSLPAAVAWCFDQARPGDAVLLSPACASLDMFRNYGHRAEVFVDAVRARAHALGEVV